MIDYSYRLAIHIHRWPHMDNWPNRWHDELCPLQPSHLHFCGAHHQQVPRDWHYLLACIEHDVHGKEGQGGRAQWQKDFGKLINIFIFCWTLLPADKANSFDQWKLPYKRDVFISEHYYCTCPQLRQPKNGPNKLDGLIYVGLIRGLHWNQFQIHAVWFIRNTYKKHSLEFWKFKKQSLVC